MAVYDDPTFLKALKLLHSPAQGTSMQLMRLFEEVIEQKYGGTKTLNPKFHYLAEESSLLEIPKTRGSRGPSPALLGPSEKSSRSSTPPSETVSIRTSPDRDEEDLALEIFEEELFCTVCKGMHVMPDNKLLECDDCHFLFHQECHKPPVEIDSDDPRSVWTCGECKKKQEKLTKSKSSESSSKKSRSEESSSSSSSKRHKEKDSSDNSESQPAKKHKSDGDKDKERSESKSGHGRKSEKEKSSSHKSSSHSGSKHSSSSSSSSSSSKETKNKAGSSPNLNFNKAPGSPNAKAPACSTNIIAADKRLQNMKKKAAAKMQEKRTTK